MKKIESHVGLVSRVVIYRVTTVHYVLPQITSV